MKFSDAIGKLHCGAGFNTGQKQKTLSVPGRLWSMYIHAVEWNLTTGLLTVYFDTFVEKTVILAEKFLLTLQSAGSTNTKRLNFLSAKYERDMADYFILCENICN